MLNDIGGDGVMGWGGVGVREGCGPLPCTLAWCCDAGGQGVKVELCQ